MLLNTKKMFTKMNWKMRIKKIALKNQMFFEVPQDGILNIYILNYRKLYCLFEKNYRERENEVRANANETP